MFTKNNIGYASEQKATSKEDEREKKMKTTLKEIKNMNAKDITSLSDKELNEIKKQERRLEEISISMGTYGINGALFKGEKTGSLYKITARCTNLFYLI